MLSRRLNADPNEIHQAGGVVGSRPMGRGAEISTEGGFRNFQAGQTEFPPASKLQHALAGGVSPATQKGSDS